MGLLVMNVMLSEDYATPDNETMLRFHVDFPIPRQHLPQLREMLQAKAWDKVEKLLMELHPQQKNLITKFMAELGVMTEVPLELVTKHAG